MKMTMKQMPAIIATLAKYDRKSQTIIRDFLNDELSEKKPATGKPSKVRPIATPSVSE